MSRWIESDFQKTSYQTEANYTDDDPYDMAGLQPMAKALETNWWLDTPDRQRQAVVNALRAGILSPNYDLKWNTIAYQDLMEIPWDDTNPDDYENLIREKKAQWDARGQAAMDTLKNSPEAPPDLPDYGDALISKYLPTFWGNIRRLANIGPYADQLREIAMQDIAQGGDGKYWRAHVLDLGIPGVGIKVASFAWLLLNPMGSKLGTIDIHMMRKLNQEKESPSDQDMYHQLEGELDNQRQEDGYHDAPLGLYQWAAWDHQRTNGYHQDHSGLRPLEPVNWRNINWVKRPPRPRPQKETPQVPGQEQLFSRWKEVPRWTLESAWKEGAWRDQPGRKPGQTDEDYEWAQDSDMHGKYEGLYRYPIAYDKVGIYEVEAIEQDGRSFWVRVAPVPPGAKTATDRGSAIYRCADREDARQTQQNLVMLLGQIGSVEQMQRYESSEQR
jgi:hypothetical protein